jgi:hypothetical protein
MSVVELGTTSYNARLATLKRRLDEASDVWAVIKIRTDAALLLDESVQRNPSHVSWRRRLRAFRTNDVDILLGASLYWMLVTGRRRNGMFRMDLPTLADYGLPHSIQPARLQMRARVLLGDEAIARAGSLADLRGLLAALPTTEPEMERVPLRKFVDRRTMPNGPLWARMRMIHSEWERDERTGNLARRVFNAEDEDAIRQWSTARRT